MNAFSMRAILAISLGIICPAALAHSGHGSAVVDGLMHPVAGVDHMIAMAGIGIWAAQQRTGARWVIPTSFVALMGIAALAGALGVSAAFIEHGIAASVLLTGLLILLSIRASPAYGMLLASSFAVFHGLAHGVDLADAGEPLQFGIGLLAATALLHVAGMLLGEVLLRSRVMTQACGATIAACGSLLALQWLH